MAAKGVRGGGRRQPSTSTKSRGMATRTVKQYATVKPTSKGTK